MKASDSSGAVAPLSRPASRATLPRRGGRETAEPFLSVWGRKTRENVSADPPYANDMRSGGSTSGGSGET
jgi:hypothetical protein